MSIYSFTPSKYTTWYFLIIYKAISQDRKRYPKNHPLYVYYESHHIIPKSFGGTEEVLLTAKEHFICHLLLTKMSDHYKMKYALHMMTCKAYNQKQDRYRITASQYEYIRKQNSMAATQRMKGVPKQKPFTKEHRENISKAAKNKSDKQMESYWKMTKQNAKEYIITFPDGHEEKIRNLSKFCREQGLNASNLNRVAGGFQSHCKGFIARRAF